LTGQLAVPKFDAPVQTGRWFGILSKKSGVVAVFLDGRLGAGSWMATWRDLYVCFLAKIVAKTSQSQEWKNISKPVNASMQIFSSAGE
jgi:hypothetical protein